MTTCNCCKTVLSSKSKSQSSRGGWWTIAICRLCQSISSRSRVNYLLFTSLLLSVPLWQRGGVKEGHFEPWTLDLRPLEGTWAGPGQDLRLGEVVFWPTAVAGGGDGGLQVGEHPTSDASLSQIWEWQILCRDCTRFLNWTNIDMYFCFLKKYTCCSK